MFSMSIRAFVALALITVSTAVGARPAGYEEANAAFRQLSTDHRVLLQVLMTGAGYYNGVPIGDFSERLLNGTKQFQSENGYPPSGVLDAKQFERLFKIAAQKYDQWGFEVVRHPTRPIVIWVPVGLGLVANRNASGIRWTDPNKRLIVDFTTVPNLEIDRNYNALVAQMASERVTFHYKVRKQDWFAISFTDADGLDGYMRYHQDGSSVTGFTLTWNNRNGDVNAERIAVLMSGSLWAYMKGYPFPNPPAKNLATVNASPTPPPSATPPTAVSPPPSAAPAPKADKPKFSSGTGFFVNTEGVIATNAHVVEDCDEIRVKTPDGTIDSARLLNRDSANDLALLKTDIASKKAARVRIGVRLGEGIAAFGYPHADMLSTSGNFTLGNVTALTGMSDDSRYFQISAPVQSGNSGGPLLDTSGNVVGVVSAKLNALKVALNGGDLTQNVNFALKSALLATYLDSNKITIQQGAVAEKPLDPADMADRAKEISVFVLCRVR